MQKSTYTIFVVFLFCIFFSCKKSEEGVIPNPAIIAPGKTDHTYNVGEAFDSYIFSIKELPGGKLLVGGGFIRYRGASRRKIARVNANASLDTTFKVGTGFDGDVSDLEILPDGKILAVGEFDYYNGVRAYGIVRLHANGTLDETFKPAIASDPVTTLSTAAVDANGKILVGGFMSSTGIIRLNADGTLDASFTAHTGGIVKKLEIDQSGRILFLGGPFNGMDRLLPNGAKDMTFNIGSGFEGSANIFRIQPDGKIVLAGTLTSFNGVPCRGIVRLQADGTVDPSFQTSIGIPATQGYSSLALQQNGKIVAAGFFDAFNSRPTTKIIRLNNDGFLDTNFQHDGVVKDFFDALEVLNDGKIITGGRFGLVSNRSFMKRLYGGD